MRGTTVLLLIASASSAAVPDLNEWKLNIENPLYLVNTYADT
jgi:hypothetical protein